MNFRQTVWKDPNKVTSYNATLAVFIAIGFIQKISLLVLFWLDMVLKDKIKISDSEKIFGTANKTSVRIDTVILLTKKKIYKNRQKGKGD